MTTPSVLDQELAGLRRPAFSAAQSDRRRGDTPSNSRNSFCKLFHINRGAALARPQPGLVTDAYFFRQSCHSAMRLTPLSRQFAEVICGTVRMPSTGCPPVNGNSIVVTDL